ncbi:MAG: DUF433 domain-containing protein [Syntrophobacteraceae bacterium]
MSENELLGRIAINPGVMVGKPVIKGTRLTVEYVLNLLAHASAFEDILQEYDDLTLEDIQACLLFATRSLESTDFMPLGSETL